MPRTPTHANPSARRRAWVDRLPEERRRELQKQRQDWEKRNRAVHGGWAWEPTEIRYWAVCGDGEPRLFELTVNADKNGYAVYAGGRITDVVPFAKVRLPVRFDRPPKRRREDLAARASRRHYAKAQAQKKGLAWHPTEISYRAVVNGVERRFQLRLVGDAFEVTIDGDVVAAVASDLMWEWVRLPVVF